MFVDTPGLHRGGSTALDEFMTREIRTALADVDADPVGGGPAPPPQRRGPGRRPACSAGSIPKCPVFMIGNKVDAAKYPDEALRLYRDLYEPARVYVP